jgi:hypothetical protein
MFKKYMEKLDLSILKIAKKIQLVFLNSIFLTKWCLSKSPKSSLFQNNPFILTKEMSYLLSLELQQTIVVLVFTFLLNPIFLILDKARFKISSEHSFLLPQDHETYW